MRRLRKFLIGVIALVVSAVSVMGGGVLAMDVYAEPIGPITKPDENSSTDTEDGASNGGADAEGAAHNLKECKTGDGKPALCEDSADGGTTMYPLPDGFSASDLPKDYKGDINEFFEAWKKAKEGDTKDIEDLYPGWSERNYTPTQDTPKENGAIGDMKDSCSGAGGAKSLGWIVCPIMSFFGSAADGVYNNLLEPLLEVDPALFTGGSGDTSTNVTREQGWGTFRDIGNGIVIVMLLVVIFSQLTGVGIDNYGIKKVLPKIVVAAILMNLSYWICVAFVDVSNILGRGLKDMFNFLADGSNLVLDTSDMENGGTANLTAFGNTLVSAAVLSAMVGGAGIMIWSNAALVLTLLVSAIGIVAAVFFLFILFAVREAAILVLVVVSPVAIALYMLPNTKSVFDKWLKLFEGLLLVYPVSGLLIGAGNFVSRLLLSGGMSSGGFFATFTSMVVGIVPVFFIPSVLRNSFNAVGNLGAKITGMGRGLGRRLQRGVGHSAGFQSARMAAFERDTRYRAGLDREGNPIDYDNLHFGRFRRFVRARQSGGMRGQGVNRSMYMAQQGGAAARNELNDDNLFQQRMETMESARAFQGFQQQFSNMSKEQLMAEARNAGHFEANGQHTDGWLQQDPQGQTRLSALISAMEARGGMENNIFDLLRNNDTGGMSGVMDTLAGSKNKVLKAYGKSGRGVSYDQFMQGFAYQDANGNLTHAAQDANGNANNRVTLYRDDNGNITQNATRTDANGNVRNNSVVSMQHYASDKAGEFVDGLDDKALSQINNYDALNLAHTNNSIMSTDQVVQAAAKLNGDDAITEVNKSLRTRGDVVNKISGEQLVNFNDATIDELLKSNVGEAALRNAANSVAANPNLRGRMNKERKDKIETNLGVAIPD